MKHFVKHVSCTAFGSTFSHFTTFPKSILPEEVIPVDLLGAHWRQVEIDQKTPPFTPAEIGGIVFCRGPIRRRLVCTRLPMGRSCSVEACIGEDDDKGVNLGLIEVGIVGIV